jgi:hypothetical protein
VANVVEDFGQLREGLRAMPVPEPRNGFVDRVLSVAAASSTKVPAPRPASRPRIWGAAIAGALAASIVWFFLAAVRVDTPTQPSVQLVLNESRDVSLVIDSDRPLEGATIRLYVTGSVELQGYEGQPDIEWLASLNQGANLISLPVVARHPGQGAIVAEIEHEGKTRRVNVLLQVRG